MEFALVSTLLLMLVFGIVQYGYYFFQLQSGSAAAREGARIAAVGVTDCGAFTAAVRARVTSVDPSAVTVTLGYPDGTPIEVRNDRAVVTVSFAPQRFGFPFVPLPSGDIIQVARTQVEYVPTGPPAQVTGCP